MLLYPHLMAKLAQELAENQDFFLIWRTKKIRYLGCFDPTHIAKWGPRPLAIGA